ncbi:chemotaxis protein CheA [Thermospira aquatica]|uniref:histidine kinase n=1 Tax=Thermospira aquatica TaxID=2828656 RepID=A0AAX3BD01_9SPIR|nr:ATP-binding protein [Thermospira aquatica]URA10146.1 Hpt domain-containing protein [Thermospira aquatica]
MILTEEIKQIFSQEARNILGSINNLLLELESNSDQKEVVVEIKRKIHTLKGSSRMIGMNNISKVAHQIENVFEFLETKDQKITSSFINFILQWLDWIQDTIEKIPEETVLEENFEEMFQKKIEEIFKETSENQTREENVSDNIPVVLQKESPQKAGQHIEKKIEEVQKKKVDYLSIKFDKIKTLLDLSNIFTNYIGRFRYLLKKLQDIDFENINKNTLASLIEIVEKVRDEFSYELHFYELYTKQFQDHVSSLILVPLGTIFNNYPRLVRDIAVSTQKEVSFTMEGEMVEVDKQLIEHINNVLIHLLRNSVDHGIESPEERVKLGKSRTGNVMLKAYPHMDRIIIEVKDDGKGIDLEKVKEKALRNGIVSQEEINGLTDEEIMQFIFRPGFSTREDVNDFSGRGVGLDVVADTMKKFNSEVVVHSEKYKGTTFSLSFPLNASVMSVTIFQIREDIFAIPSLNIEKVLLLSESKIAMIEGEEMLEYEHKWIPVVDLARLFYDISSQEDIHKENIIIISHHNRDYALLVGRIIGENRAVIKSVFGMNNKLAIVAGVLTLSSRDVIVLNLFELIEKYRDRQS